MARFSSIAACMALTGLAVPAPVVFAGEWTDEELTFFESEVRPLLVKHCYECHSEEAGKRKGGLWLDRRGGWSEGGDAGPALVPGEPDKSLLIHSIRYGDPDLQMPPKSRLSGAEISTLEKWVALGAPDPRDAAMGGGGEREIDYEAARKEWAFRPVVKPDLPVPADSEWGRRPVDDFILAALEAEGLAPARDADAAVLLRRVHYDLTGLPPTVEELRSFVADPSAKVFAKVVDELLARPAFGEKWGRHWLDVARYADSNGGDRNYTFYQAWRYRNYVIASFHRDKPYYEFLREQVAGDLMSAPDPATRRGQIIASTFLALGPKMLTERDKEKLWLDTVDEQIDTIGRAFLGLTLGCARCHDHKFDPISQEEYYALAGIFRSTEVVTGTRNGCVNVASWIERPLPGSDGINPELQKRVERLELAMRLTVEKRGNKNATVADEGADPLFQMSAGELRKELGKMIADLKDEDLAMAPRDAADPGDIHLRVRGEPAQLGPLVPRGFPRLLGEEAPSIPAGSSGRLELADWLVSPDNGLLDRVVVNRVWGYLFGRGIVETVDNFGRLGSGATHPELLDYLAARFREDGGSFKTLIRDLVLSRTYRLGATASGKLREADPANRFFGRHERRRLTAEEFRDSVLFLSGQLDPAPGGATATAVGIDLDKPLSYAEKKKRTLYLPIARNNPSTLLSLFDGANPDLVSGRRNETTVPTQALYLLNSSFLQEQAAAIGKRAMEPGGLAGSEVDRLYEALLGRLPRPQERTCALGLIADLSGGAEDPEHLADAVSHLAHILLASTEFLYLE